MLPSNPMTSTGTERASSNAEQGSRGGAQVTRWGLPTRIAVTILIFVSGAGTTLKLGELVSEKGGPSWPGLLWLAFLLVGSLFLVWASAAVWLQRDRALLSRGLSISLIIAGVASMVVASVLMPEQFDVQADRDEALEIAATRLWSGLDPWGQTTHLGPDQVITPFLGGILLSAPFVLLFGNSTIQMLAIGSIGLVLLVRQAGYRAASAGFVIFALSPVWLNELVYEHDIALNAVVVAIAAGWAIFAVQRSERPALHIVGAGVLISLGVTDRFFFLSVALLLGIVLFRIDARRALAWLAVTGASVLILVALPLATWPDSVRTILTESYSKSDSSTIPGSGIILAALTILVVLVGARLVRRTSHVYLVASAALAVMPIWLVLVESIGGGRLELTSYVAQTYWAPCVVFGLLGFLMPRTPLVPDQDRRGRRPAAASQTVLP